MGLPPGIGEEHGEEVIEEGGGGVLRKAGESPRRLAAQSKTTCSSSVHAGEQIHLCGSWLQREKEPIELEWNLH